MLLDIMYQRLMVVRDIGFTCMVLCNILRTHQGGADRAPSQANNVAVPQNKQVVYVADDNNRNP